MALAADLVDGALDLVACAGGLDKIHLHHFARVQHGDGVDRRVGEAETRLPVRRGYPIRREDGAIEGRRGRGQIPGQIGVGRLGQIAQHKAHGGGRRARCRRHQIGLTIAGRQAKARPRRRRPSRGGGQGPAPLPDAGRHDRAVRPPAARSAWKRHLVEAGETGKGVAHAVCLFQKHRIAAGNRPAARAGKLCQSVQLSASNPAAQGRIARLIGAHGQGGRKGRFKQMTTAVRHHHGGALRIEPSRRSRSLSGQAQRQDQHAA